jgi:hypothetical protein
MRQFITNFTRIQYKVQHHKYGQPSQIIIAHSWGHAVVFIAFLTWAADWTEEWPARYQRHTPGKSSWSSPLARRLMETATVASIRNQRTVIQSHLIIKHQTWYS